MQDYFEIVEGDGWTVIRFLNNFCSEFITENQAQFKELLAECNRDCILDFVHVKRIDSQGIGLLVKASNTLKKKGFTLQLANLDPDVLKVFRVMGLEKVFQFN